MNNSLLPRERKKVPRGIEPNRLFSLHYKKKKSLQSLISILHSLPLELR